MNIQSEDPLKTQRERVGHLQAKETEEETNTEKSLVMDF